MKCLVFDLIVISKLIGKFFFPIQIFNKGNHARSLKDLIVSI